MRLGEREDRRLPKGKETEGMSRVALFILDSSSCRSQTPYASPFLKYEHLFYLGGPERNCSSVTTHWADEGGTLQRAAAEGEPMW